MSSQESVLVEINDPVLSITIQRREHINAINYETHVNLSEAFDRFVDDLGLSLDSIAGTGTSAFCVGNDLKERHERGNDVMLESGFGDLPGFLASTNLWLHWLTVMLLGGQLKYQLIRTK